MTTSPRSNATAGETVEALRPADVAELERALTASGIDLALTRGCYAVVFVYPGMGIGNVYPDLAGCTKEVCTFIERASGFAKHGVQVVGLSGEVTEPPESCLAIPFPVGVIPQDQLSGGIDAVERDGRRYAVRTSFLRFPAGDGVRVSGISDVVAHVDACFDLIDDHRRRRYREATIGALCSQQPDRLHAIATTRGLLANGADSVAITRVDVTIPLVCKMADRRVIREEAEYIDRVNRLLEEVGRPPLFPRVVTVVTDEYPAWYLMEAAEPMPLDRLVFANPERTVLDPAAVPLLEHALARLTEFHRLTFRREVPPVSRYHYLERFHVVPGRSDTREAYATLFGGPLDELLEREAVLDGGFRCRPYREQVDLLARRVGELAQPVASLVHGDAHLPNMLLLGGDVRFVDPRTVWDGNEVGEPGVADPLYDLSTLLHSLHVMSAILRAVADDKCATLLDVSLGGDALDVRSGVLRIHDNDVLRWFLGWIEEHVPTDLLGLRWRARLHAGAANALLGWLKYARAVPSAAAWMSVFSSVLYHLELSNRELDGEAQ